MNLRAIIDEIADRADDFLAGASNRAEARAGVNELINADYARLSPAERRQVADGVMNILEAEGFFENTPGGRSGEAASADEEE